MFGTNLQAITLDMSEYLRSTPSRVCSVPLPGTWATKRRPAHREGALPFVVLFDEIEKAHQDLFNSLPDP